MAADVTAADLYFADVLHNAEWVEADADTKRRALEQAEKQLYRYFKIYTPDNRPLPAAAMYEQAIWLLRMDEAVRKTQQGVRSVGVAGVQVSGETVKPISPEVLILLGRRVGRYDR
ncbi:hypothetical protein [Heliophilum fasciatum]|uniref:Phage gp6-like head-tail connector protein n=1 Tax=Heliophilum fasciatum TaxID=35700 RepID=A0A4R2RK16_9FIRM|nr:hypothetical protein [Heliophilum fasciatum]MCW2278734.1 hypothetical protein [Heliophilum fasciatum]TCP62527.1 hypothetical protein EDD73_12125 [Heliophilum fasciatum]